MSKQSTYKTIKRVEDGVTIYTKQCPRCKMLFDTTSRRQKYCSDKCCKLQQKRRRISKKNYDEQKDLYRLKARSHAVAVQTLKCLEDLGQVEHICSKCGGTDNLEVHHVNLCWLDNTPSNIVYLCKKCHSKAHSELEHSLDEQGILVGEYREETLGVIARLVKR